MNPAKLSYLLTDFIFAGSAIIVIWHRHKRYLKKHWEFVMDFMVFSIPFAYLDYFAIKWGAYSFNPDKRLGIDIFGAPIEDYIFLALVGIAVSSYTIVCAKKKGIVTKAHAHAKKNKQRLSKPRKPALAAAYAKR